MRNYYSRYPQRSLSTAQHFTILNRRFIFYSFQLITFALLAISVLHILRVADSFNLRIDNLLLPSRNKSRTPLFKGTYFKPLVKYFATNVKIRKKDDGAWVAMDVPSGKTNFRLFIYSAFCDDRPSLNSNPVVRIIGVSDQKRTKDKSLQCVIQYINGTRLTVPLSPKNDIGFGTWFDEFQTHLQEFIYTCKTRSSDCPQTVAIHTKVEGKIGMTQTTQWIAVHKPLRPQKKENFGVCVQIAYNALNATRLVEWFEMQKILGVTRIGIYNHSIARDSAAGKVLRHYDGEGLVELRQSHPFTKAPKDGSSAHWTPVINDCIYRNIYRLKKILVIDFDEVIVPRQHLNLSSMISAIDATQKESHSARSYVFTNDYFFLDHPADESQYRHSVYLRYRRRQYPSGPGYSVKSIIDPQSCVRMHNHYCWETTPGHDQGTKQVEPVPLELGLNQHYKRCHFNTEECQALLKNNTLDDLMLRFKEPLTNAVTLALEKVQSFQLP